MGVMHVVNDTIIAAGPGFADYTHREINVRNAMFIITCGAPIIASLFCLFSTPNWAKASTLYTYPKLCAIWFLTIGIVGISLYFEPGTTPRIVFIIAGIHGQVEVMINALFLGATGRQALIITWAWSLFQFGCTLTIKSPITLFIIAAVIGGTNDFMMFLTTAYGKQWGLALAAMGHLLSAVTVFVGIVENIGVVPWNALSFLGLWTHIFFVVNWIYNARRIALPTAISEDGAVLCDDPPANPLHNVKWTPRVVIGMIAFSAVSSTVITLLLAFVIPGPGKF